MSTSLRPTTAIELEQMEDDGYRYDLLRGELLQMSPAGQEHGGIAFEFARLLGNFVIEHNLGKVYASETGFILERNPDTVLAPDVSFVRRERLPEIQFIKGFIPLAPDLATEVISPSDRYKKVDEKIETWLEAGTRAVVVLDPRKKHARIHRPADEIQTVQSNETLELPDIVPGWSLRLTLIFG